MYPECHVGLVVIRALYQGKFISGRDIITLYHNMALIRGIYGRVARNPHRLLQSGIQILGIIVLDHYKYTVLYRGINKSGITHTGVAELHLTGGLSPVV